MALEAAEVLQKNYVWIGLCDFAMSVSSPCHVATEIAHLPSLPHNISRHHFPLPFLQNTQKLDKNMLIQI